MPICKSGIDQKNKKPSEKLKVSLSAPSTKGQPTSHNLLIAHVADPVTRHANSNTCFGNISLQKNRTFWIARQTTDAGVMCVII
jgi:hypothetical protein